MKTDDWLPVGLMIFSVFIIREEVGVSIALVTLVIFSMRMSETLVHLYMDGLFHKKEVQDATQIQSEGD